MGYSTVGRCQRKNQTLDSDDDPPEAVWAYDFCPTPYGFMALIALALYLLVFAPGKCVTIAMMDI